MRTIILAIVTAALGCQVEAPGDELADTTPAQARPDGPQLELGQELVYALTWEVDAGVRPDADASDPSGGPTMLPMAGGLHLDATLSLQAVGEREGATVVAAWFSEVSSVSLVVAGKPSPIDASMLLGERAYFQVGEDGDVPRMWFGPETSSFFRHVMAGALDRVDLRAAAGDQHRVMRTAHGLAEVRYVAGPGGTLRREHARLARFDAMPGIDASVPQIDAEAELELDGRGLPVRISVVEQATVREPGWSFGSHDRFALRMLEVRTGEALSMPEELEAYTHRDPEDAPDMAERERAFSQQLADGMHPSDVRDGVTAMQGGMFPHAGLISRSIGLLRGWPETAYEMIPVAHGTGSIGRQLVFDLLATAGTPESQAVMRELVLSDDAREWEELPLLVGRFAFVPQPTTETALFVVELRTWSLAEGRGELADATLWPLGTLVSTLDRTDPWLAEVLHRKLIAVFEPSTGSTRIAAIDALGNASRVADAWRVLPLVADGDAEVRLAAVTALRGMISHETTTALATALGDPDEAVAYGALSSLEQHLDRDGSSMLAALATEQRYNRNLEHALVNALVPRLGDDPSVRTALLAIADRSTDEDLRSRIELELET